MSQNEFYRRLTLKHYFQPEFECVRSSPANCELCNKFVLAVHPVAYPRQTGACSKIIALLDLIKRRLVSRLARVTSEDFCRDLHNTLDCLRCARFVSSALSQPPKSETCCRAHTARINKAHKVWLLPGISLTTVERLLALHTRPACVSS